LVVDGMAVLFFAMLPSVRFTEEKVLLFLFSVKNAKIVHL